MEFPLPQRVSERRVGESDIYLIMRIPNIEVKYIDENHIRGWFEQRVAQMDLGALFSATLTGDTETMETEIGRMLLEKSCEAALFTGRTAV